jgi:hypothetical protein
MVELTKVQRVTYGYRLLGKRLDAYRSNYGIRRFTRVGNRSACEGELLEVLDAVSNHTGPVTKKISLAKRLGENNKQCTYDNYENSDLHLGCESRY